MSTVVSTSPGLPGSNPSRESGVSAVSWAAVFAGAFVAAALSLSLLSLGTGFGLAAVSPWSSEGIPAAKVGMAGIAWLIAMQIVAASVGGYLAGRLRTKWVDLHGDEVYFRDTAHGFLVWAVGLVITASFLASAVASVVSGVAQAGEATATLAGGAAMSMSAGHANDMTPNAGGSKDYWVDSLFRSGNGKGDGSDSNVRAEVVRILVNDGTRLPPTDKTYLVQLIAKQTGVAPAEIERRVAEMEAQLQAKETAARQAADSARKAAMKLSLWLFVGLLAGAFCASYAATLGGRRRDRMVL